MNIEVDNYADYKELEISGRYITNESIANLNFKYISMYPFLSYYK